MRRVSAVIVVPALVFLALSILALDSGRKRETSENTRPSPNQQPDEQTGGEGKRSQDESPASDLAGEVPDALSRLTNASAAPAAKTTGTTGTSEAGKSEGDNRETLAEKFGRLMKEERVLKTGSDVEPNRTAAKSTETAERQPPKAPSIKASTSPASQAAIAPSARRDQLISALPIFVARAPGDLLDLDSEQVFGQLTVTGDQFTNRSLKALEGLRILSVSVEAVNVTNAALQHLAKVDDLRELRLWSPGVTDDGLAQLGDLSALELLDLEGTNVTGEGLADLSGVDTLTHLTLGPQCEDRYLTSLGSFPRLAVLDLRSCRKLTDACLKAIGACDKLQMVWLPAQVGRDNKGAVRQELSNVTVRW